VHSPQDGEADISGADSLGAVLGATSLGVVLCTGASVSVPLDVLLPDGEHATSAAPIAKINRTFFSMDTSWGFEATLGIASLIGDTGDRRGRGASVMRPPNGSGVAGGSQSVRPDTQRAGRLDVVMRA
jgi:hypothetical protein